MSIRGLTLSILKLPWITREDQFWRDLNSLAPQIELLDKLAKKNGGIDNIPSNAIDELIYNRRPELRPLRQDLKFLENLEKKNRGVDNPSDVIDEYDIYNRRPELLPRDSWIVKEDELYYYVKPKYKESSIDRSVENGYGCWKSTGEVVAIKHKDLVIGYKHIFNFRIGKNRRETNWMMEEYRLASQSSLMDQKRLVECGTSTKANEFFLCKIYERSSEETLTRSKRMKTSEMNGSWDISAEDL